MAVYWLNDLSRDGIVYGFAFRAHWYWHNNYGPNSQSFIIWKDYRCDIGRGLAPTSFTMGSGNHQIRDAMNLVAAANPAIKSDIWRWTHDVVEDHIKGAFATLYSVPPDQMDITAFVINGFPNKGSSWICPAFYRGRFYYMSEKQTQTH